MSGTSKVGLLNNSRLTDFDCTEYRKQNADYIIHYMESTIKCSVISKQISLSMVSEYSTW